MHLANLVADFAFCCGRRSTEIAVEQRLYLSHAEVDDWQVAREDVAGVLVLVDGEPDVGRSTQSAGRLGETESETPAASEQIHRAQGSARLGRAVVRAHHGPEKALVGHACGTVGHRSALPCCTGTVRVNYRRVV
jgi:hypothetical protein